MANLILPSRRIIQPQDAMRIDWGNPLTRGLEFAYDPIRQVNVVSNNKATGFNATSMSLKPNTEGFAVAYDGSQAAGGNYFAPTEDAFTRSGKFTVATGWYTNTTTNHQLLHKWVGGVGGLEWISQADTQYFGGILQDGGNVNIRAGGSISTTRLNNFIQTNDAASLVIYQDGLPVGLSDIWVTGSPTVPQVTASNLEIANSLNGSIVWCFGFSRVLSAAEARQLADNPWQILTSKKRVLYFDVAVGGGTSTLTIINPLETISNSVVFTVSPKITLIQNLATLNNEINFSVKPKVSFNNALEDSLNTLSLGVINSFDLSNTLDEGLNALTFTVSPEVNIGNTLLSVANALDFTVLGYTGLEITSTLVDSANALEFTISPTLNITHTLAENSNILDFTVGGANSIVLNNILSTTVSELSFQVSPRVSFTQSLETLTSSLNFSISPRIALVSVLETVQSDLIFTVDTSVVYAIENILGELTNSVNFNVLPRLALSGTLEQVQNTLSFASYVNPDIYFEVITLKLKVNASPNIPLKINLVSTLPLEL